MKIAIIGTHFSGKTELVRELSDLFKERYSEGSLATITEIIRRCPLPVNEGTIFEAQKWILMQQIKEEIEKSGSKIIVSDRSVVDNYIYMMRKFPEQARAFLPLVLEHAKTYDYIFKTAPLETEIEDDGFRDTSPEFRAEIEDMLKKFLTENKIGFHDLPSENSAEFILKVVSDEAAD